MQRTDSAWPFAAGHLAYALLLMHVALGALYAEGNPLYLGILVMGVTVVIGLHLATGFKERHVDTASPRMSEANRGGPPSPPTPLPEGEGSNATWIDVCGVDEIPNNRAKVVSIVGCERIAIFRYDGKISAVTNVCAHQLGPLGEGKVIDGCITCPWHGWEYRPHNGQSPPPFNERITTYRVHVVNGRVFVNPVPLPPGTPVEPACMGAISPHRQFSGKRKHQQGDLGD